MATLNSTQLRKGVVFKDGNRVYLVLEYKHVKKGRGLATVRVKVEGIETGAKVSKTFTSNEKVESVDLARRRGQYLYCDSEYSYFMDSKDYSQFQLKSDSIKHQRKFLVEGMEVEALWLEGRAICIELPKKVKLKVVSTEPGILGDTAGRATKSAELETELLLQVPLFIKTGDVLVVNTEKGKYVSKG